MNDKPPEIIYLMPYDNGYVWCEDPAPEVDMDGSDAITYMRVDAFVEQAFEAINAIEEGPQPLVGNYHNGISKAEARQAIKDKFK